MMSRLEWGHRAALVGLIDAARESPSVLAGWWLTVQRPPLVREREPFTIDRDDMILIERDLGIFLAVLALEAFDRFGAGKVAP